MARALRINRPEVWYHISARGTERRTIFTDDAVLVLELVTL